MADRCTAAMDRGVCIRRFAGRGRRVGGQEARAEKGCTDKDLPILSRAGPRRPRGLIYEWDQTPEVADGADWPSPVPLWYPVRPIIGWFLLSRPVSLSLSSLSLSFSLSLSCLPFFLFLLSSPRTAPYLDTAPPLLLLLLLTLPLQFLPFRSFACPRC